MFPDLFRIGDFRITSFGATTALAVFVGGWIIARHLKRQRMDPEVAWDVLVWMVVFGLIGAKLYYLALHPRDVAADPVRAVLSRGGLVWYGAFIGGVVAFIWQSKKRRLPLPRMLDALAPALALGHAIGRLGCFLVGDDYGVPTDSWVGIAFPKGSPPTTAENFRRLGIEIPPELPNDAVLRVHPTQLYELGALLLIFALLWRMWTRGVKTGRLFATYLATYGVARFVIEFFRAKDDRFLGVLSTSGALSLVLIALGAYLWWHFGRVREKQATR